MYNKGCVWFTAYGGSIVEQSCGTLGGCDKS